MVFRSEAYDWLCRVTGIPFDSLQLVRLKGSTSSAIYRVENATSSGQDRFVLRVLDNPTWLAEEPDLAEHEAAALTEARNAGLRAPEVIAFSSTDVGFGAPIVLMSFVEGSVELQPADFVHWVEQLATELATIHRHSAPGFAWNYVSWVNTEAAAVPTWTKVPTLWEKALTIGLGPQPESPTVFLHRDYHPTNVLWKSGTIHGVVDWINACRGPAGVDIAHCRINLNSMFGPEAAATFLEKYLALVDGYTYHPYWDLHVLMDETDPGFYRPWQEFGLDIIPRDVLQHRVDEHLKSVIQKM
jgi:aminoglycoside phosphotransferase (APT) family kinase protein